MNLDTPEGTLNIDGDELRFVPTDLGPEVRVSLKAGADFPNFKYTRGIYGNGTLDIGDAVIVLTTEQAPQVVEELRKRRDSTPAKPAAKGKTHKADNDDVSVATAAL